MDGLAEIIKKRIADYTVGFLRFEVSDGNPDAMPMGTGTLVDIGQTKGILTAAHVLAELPNTGPVGIVRFFNKEDKLQKLTLEMGHTQKISLGTAPFSEWGPDLAFLRLPFDTAGSLAATNNYVNFNRAREENELPATPYFDAVVGEIGEWTKNLSPKKPVTKLKGVQALFATGNIANKVIRDGLDFVDLQLVYEEGFEPPHSYGGVSGGGLWRCYLDSASAPKELRFVRLHGVAFWENDPTEPIRVIRSHGPRSIFGALYEKITENGIG